MRAHPSKNVVSLSLHSMCTTQTTRAPPKPTEEEQKNHPPKTLCPNIFTVNYPHTPTHTHALLSRRARPTHKPPHTVATRESTCKCCADWQEREDGSTAGVIRVVCTRTRVTKHEPQPRVRVSRKFVSIIFRHECVKNQTQPGEKGVARMGTTNPVFHVLHFAMLQTFKSL